MKRVYGNENHVTVLIGYLDDLVITALVINFSHQTAENSNSVVNVDDIVTYVERIEVVEGKLFALFHGSSE